MLFIDTCFLLSLVNVKSPNHEAALMINDLIKDEYTIINSIVLTELFNRLHQKRYEGVRQEIIDKVYEINKIHYLTKEDYDEAFKICNIYNFTVNYVDYAILKTMMNYKVTTIISFDGDFDKIKGINKFYL